MIVSFRDPGTEDIFNGRNSRRARKTYLRNLWPIATRKLDQVDSAWKSAGGLKRGPQRSIQHLHQPARPHRLCLDRQGPHRGRNRWLSL